MNTIKSTNNQNYLNGRNSALEEINKGRTIHLIEEEQTPITKTCSAWSIGWNSVVFNQKTLQKI